MCVSCPPIPSINSKPIFLFISQQTNIIFNFKQMKYKKFSSIYKTNKKIIVNVFFPIKKQVVYSKILLLLSFTFHLKHRTKFSACERLEGYSVLLIMN